MPAAVVFGRRKTRSGVAAVVEPFAALVRRASGVAVHGPRLEAAGFDDAPMPRVTCLDAADCLRAGRPPKATAFCRSCSLFGDDNIFARIRIPFTVYCVTMAVVAETATRTAAMSVAERFRAVATDFLDMAFRRRPTGYQASGHGGCQK
jgi:hypothetical protein